jgi:hypothetical protein
VPGQTDHDPSKGRCGDALNVGRHSNLPLKTSPVTVLIAQHKRVGRSARDCVAALGVQQFRKRAGSQERLVKLTFAELNHDAPSLWSCCKPVGAKPSMGTCNGRLASVLLVSPRMGSDALVPPGLTQGDHFHQVRGPRTSVAGFQHKAVGRHCHSPPNRPD